MEYPEASAWHRTTFCGGEGGAVRRRRFRWGFRGVRAPDPFAAL